MWTGKGGGASHPLVLHELGNKRAEVVFTPLSEFGVGKRWQILNLYIEFLFI